ncbi:ABC transporter ATP-binding protein [Aquipuribacter nitratireducens]|uniref:ABC transporter ATP-binding protein n=1 Tax=Aquipuribacter nitratireducens TaxID=650104 RepID=A0ABW0GNN9_9MICO
MTGALVVDVALPRGGLEVTARVDVAPGEVVVVVGPNGAGKSTLLHVVAGLVAPARGRVALAGRVLDDPAAGVRLPVPARRVGLVPQDLQLFPHLDVRDNVAFGLRAAGARAAPARAVAERWCTRLGLTDEVRHRPGRLSGGQRQRVALARALAPEPDALLLDEPLAALDAGTRVHVRAELRHHLADVAVPTLLVTHDPVDAMVLADRVVVVEAGRVVQSGTPREVARAPRTDYVARLVGLNRWEGVAAGGVARLAGGRQVHVVGGHAGPVLLTFPPHAVTLWAEAPHGASTRNVWPARVAGLEPHADTVRVRVVAEDGTEALADVTALAVADLDLRPGAPVWAGVKATEVTVHPG